MGGKGDHGGRGLPIERNTTSFTEELVVVREVLVARKLLLAMAALEVLRVIPVWNIGVRPLRNALAYRYLLPFAVMHLPMMGFSQDGHIRFFSW